MKSVMGSSDSEVKLTFELSKAALLEAIAQGMRVALVGPSGLGKSTLAAQVAAQLEAQGVPLTYLSVDPGRPGASPEQPPGAISRCVWRDGAWHVLGLEALASMDCARHRLQLTTLAARLAREVSAGAVLVDTPGMTRGVQAAELLGSLCEVLHIERVFALLRDKDDPQFLEALRGVGVQVVLCEPAAAAKKLSDGQRQLARDEAWRGFLAGATQERFELASLRLLGSPPEPCAWEGVQVAMLGAQGQTLGLGVVLSASAVACLVQWRRVRDGQVSALLVRDVRVIEGKLRTSRHDSDAKSEAEAPPWADVVTPDEAFTPRQRPKIRIHLSDGPMLAGASIRVTFIGDLFDDPMVLLRLDHRQRCLWFDAGEVAHVPTRFVRQTSDIFMSHAHLDHFGDFPWLLRRMMGVTEPMRVWGPVGIIERVTHMVQAFTWDRIGERGPRFMVHEWEGGAQAKRALVQAGLPEPVFEEDLPVRDGVLWREPLLKVTAAVLDHGGLPVLAYAVEETHQFAVRGNVLRERGWSAGAWLGQLKSLAALGELDGQLEVTCMAEAEPEVHEVEALVDALLIRKPGQKIVYATDFADTEVNRQALLPLARDAHLLICEASFIMDDLDQAVRTGHMTTKGCAAIAAQANARWLVPFHHSMRYELNPELVYEELLEGFANTYVPAPILKVINQRKAAQVSAGQAHQDQRDEG